MHADLIADLDNKFSDNAEESIVFTIDNVVGANTAFRDASRGVTRGSCRSYRSFLHYIRVSKISKTANMEKRGVDALSVNCS